MLYFFTLVGVAAIVAGSFHASGMTAGYLAFSLVLALTGAGVQLALQPSIKEPALVTAGAETQNTDHDTQEEKVSKEEKSDSAEIIEGTESEMKKNEKAEKKKAAKEKAEAEKAAKAEKKAAKEKKAKDSKAKDSSGKGKTAAAVASEKPAAQSAKKGNYIENPLPLPKKHETKILDYPYFVATDKLRYDVKVSSDDDFDI